MRESTKIVLNTGVLYVKAVTTIAVALFSTRFVLQALGSEDYGIFALIGGIFAFLAFLNSTLASSSVRFLSYHRGNAEILAKVFNSAFVLNVSIGCIISLVLWLAGLALFSGVLRIDPDRLSAAQVVYQCMIVSTFVTVVSGTFDAAIISHEHQIYSAIIGITDAVAKLAISLCLFVVPGDRLAWYGYLLATEAVVILAAKWIYCARNYPESRLHPHRVNMEIFRSLTGFSFWTSIDTTTHILRDQSMTIFLNRFFGVSVNAANGISRQVNGQIAFFSNVVFQAASPQIIQLVSKQELDKAVEKSLSVSKMAFLLMAFFSIPLILTMPQVLQLWLVDVPQYSTELCRMALLATMVYMLGAGLNVLLEGMGQVKTYRLTASTISLAAIALGYFSLRHGMPAESVYLVLLLANAVLVFWMVLLSVRSTPLTITQYLLCVPVRLVPVVALVFFATWIVPLPSTFSVLAVVLSKATISTLLLVGLGVISLDRTERQFVYSLGRRIRWRSGSHGS